MLRGGVGAPAGVGGPGVGLGEGKAVGFGVEGVGLGVGHVPPAASAWHLMTALGNQ